MLSMLNASSTALYVWLAVLGVLVIAIAVFVGVVPISVWIRAMVSGAHISAMRLIGMKLRKVDYKKIVDIYIVSQKAGLDIPIVELETHLMAGGDIEKVVDALISAHSAKLDLTLELAKAIDYLDPKEKQVISLYYYENLNLREIGEVLDISQQRVSQIRKKALDKMYEIMKEYRYD